MFLLLFLPVLKKAEAGLTDLCFFIHVAFDGTNAHIKHFKSLSFCIFPPACCQGQPLANPYNLDVVANLYKRTSDSF